MPPPLPRALLLDLDDTILVYGPSAEPIWERETRASARELGVDPASLLAAVREAGRRYWGEPERSRLGRQDLRGARRRICLWAFEGLGLPDEAAARLADAFHDAREAGVQPLPGALEALEALRRRDLPLVLVTNGGAELQRRKIERFDLAGFFREILVEGELGYGKPDGRVYARALRAAAVDPGDAWMVGDNLHADVGGAQAAGVAGVWVDPERRGLPEGVSVRPDHVVQKLADLLETG